MPRFQQPETDKKVAYWFPCDLTHPLKNAEMKKLLLLTLFPLVAFVSSFAGKVQHVQNGETNFNDSTLKVTAINPRTGFKNLFDQTTEGTSGARLNPMAVSFVQDYIVSNSKRLDKMKSWGRPYFDMMDGVLTRYGLPAELKYLSVIESDLKAYAVSWAGAVGPWQFMPQTARFMGLRVGNGRDERTDFNKSTNAAARYLSHLYGIYNDWLLVIAAYNGGPGNVDKAIRRSGSRNFWNLQYHLPTESRNHVKKFIATHYIMEGSAGITTLTKSERTELAMNPVEPAAATPLTADMLQVSGKYNSMVMAQYLKMSIIEFNRLNPGFDKQLAISGTYNLRLPADKMLEFQAAKPQILEQSIKLMLASATKSF